MPVAVFAFFTQPARCIVMVCGSDVVKTHFLAQQSARRIAQAVTLPLLVENVADLQVVVVVAVAQGAAVRQGLLRQQVKRRGVVICGDFSGLVLKPGDFAVSVVAVLPGGAVREGDAGHAPRVIIPVAGDVAFAVGNAGDPQQGIVGVAADLAVRAALCQQLAFTPPFPGVNGAVRVTHLRTLAPFIVAVVRFLLQRVNGQDYVSLRIIFIPPYTLPFLHLDHSPKLMAERHRSAIRVNNFCQLVRIIILVMSNVT